MTKRRLTGKQPGKLSLPGPEIAQGLPLRKRKTTPVMPGSLLKRLDEHKKHQGLVEYQQNQRLHEQARNMEGEMIRLGTMAGGYMPSMRTGIPLYLRERIAQRNELQQKINRLNK